MEDKIITQAGGNAPARELNMEMMRIVAMMLVLLVHATFLSNPWPVKSMFEDAPVNTFIFSYVEAIGLVCVNCFILISGYFSIRPKMRSLCNLLFLIYFYKILFFGIDWAVNGYSSLNLQKTLFPFTDWFVGAYLGLYLLSPVINKYVDTAPEKEFRTFLIIYLTVQILLGWFMPYSCESTKFDISVPFMEFGNGYSVFAFIGLYCIARYVKIHGHAALSKLIDKWKARDFLLLFFALTLANTIFFAVARLYVSSAYTSYYLSHLFEKYTNPFTIAASVCLLFFFMKLKVKSTSGFAPAIIVFGKSAFAVYLIHFNFFTLPYFKQCAHAIYESLPIWGWVVAIAGFVIAVYTVCVLIDQARLALWGIISKR